MKTAKELEALFGVSAKRIAELDADACEGKLHGTPAATTIGPQTAPPGTALAPPPQPGAKRCGNFPAREPQAALRG